MSWQLDLAMIRRRAAAKCGLAEYPYELIKASESFKRTTSAVVWQARADRLRRALEGLRYIDEGR